jgi:hypothetical protein
MARLSQRSVDNSRPSEDVMRRDCVFLAAALMIGVVPCSVANAGTCSPGLGSDSDIPCGINLVGTHNGVADPRGQFTITIRDLAHNTIPDCEVTIDFGACSDIRIATVQSPGITMECLANPSPHAVVHATTDANGVVRISIVGFANNTAAHSPGSGFKCATVYAGATQLGNVNVGAFDQNGSGGINPVDISAWLVDAFDYPAVYRGRSDFNCTDTISPADLSVLLAALFGSGSTASATDYCH